MLQMVYQGEGVFTAKQVRWTPAGSLTARRVQSSLQFQHSRRDHPLKPGDIRAVAQHFRKPGGVSTHSVKREQVFLSSSDSRRSTHRMKFGIFILPSWPRPKPRTRDAFTRRPWSRFNTLRS